MKEKLKNISDPVIPALQEGSRWQTTLIKLQRFTKISGIVSETDKSRCIQNQDIARLNRLKHTAQGIGATIFAEVNCNPGWNSC